MDKNAPYSAPQGLLQLRDNVVRPPLGTLPIRGDLAHIALAESYLVPHYAVPHMRTVANGPTPLHLHPDEKADILCELAQGSTFELLDISGEWCWGCVGPDGPSGWVPAHVLAPQES